MVPAGGGSRSLKTAATVLRALRLLGDHPDGLSASDLAEELGKSAATARYMINTLCEAGYAEREGSGRCRLSDAPPWGHWGTVPAASPVPGDPDPGAVLAEATTELYRRTRQRSYLVRRTGTVVATVTDSRGHQGLAKHPGLGTHVPPIHAHALAMTKVLLATSAEYREAVDEEGDALTALTPATVTDLSTLQAELEDVRRDGVALDREEFAGGFASIAAPVVSPSGAATVALGLSCSARRLALDEDELVEAVRAVAARASAQWAGEIGARQVGMPPARPNETVERDAPLDREFGFTGPRR
ncbi:IclR family transcriptional regulator [Actinomycetospora succinea]|uniref:IclR family transcriptional regulator n=1 Tax=Actinomycetospora succinea TaxID=663603 RepID=A0A4R6V2D1_9PSEU|nr:IclR family transcriptional regulator [Actinomycetospora succinea]